MVNFFEVIGVERQEIRHSRFLAFLLNPSREHELGDLFLRRLLHSVAKKMPQTASGTDRSALDALSFASATVQCECKNIDILIRDYGNQVAVIIENKIGSGEHSNQLARYWDDIARQYCDWTIVGLYLSPSGDAPSDARYIPISYDLVCSLLDDLLVDGATAISDEVASLIRQYVDVLHRRIARPVSIDIHGQAVKSPTLSVHNGLFTPVPKNNLERIGDLLESLILDTGLCVTWSKPTGRCFYLDFSYADWPVHTTLWALPLGYEIAVSREGVELNYYIHRDATLEMKVRLLKMAHQWSPPFHPSRSTTNTIKSQSIYKYRLLEVHEMGGEWDGVEALLTQRWRHFAGSDLQHIRNAVTRHADSAGG